MATPITDAVYAPGRQSWNYESHWLVSGNTVRVRIVRDSHVHQSSAVADVFDTLALQWNPLARLFPAHMAVCQPLDPTSPRGTGRERVSYVHTPDRLDRSAFLEDRDSLLELADRILGAPVLRA